MRALTFRAKLFLIVGSATFSLSAVVVGSALGSLRATQHLADVEGRLVPKLELGPRLERAFDSLNQGLADAVSAQDARALEETLATRNRLLELIARAGPEIDPAAAMELRWSLGDYYDLAHSVGARSIAGETGEALVNDMARMQERRAILLASIKKSTGLNRSELRAGFAAVREANQRADELRLWIGLGGLSCVVALSLWAARRMLGMVGRLSTGLSRFEQGDFSSPIVALQDDELGRLAVVANRMAESLRHEAAQRASNEWVESGRREVSDELRGELEPEELARRALAVLARRVQAYVGAFYRADGTGWFRLLAELAPDGVSAERSFRLGEGLLGEAARHGELRILRAEPESGLRLRSGLAEIALHSLVVLPVCHEGTCVALVELGLRAPCAPDAERLLGSVRQGLAISLLAAQSRAVLTDRNAELEQARAGLQEKAEELARVSSYKSQFLANMSHELRTPLNSMLLLSHLLAENEDGRLSERQVLHCKTIHSAGQDLLKLINQVLDLAKIEAGREQVQLEEVALRDFVAYARKVFDPLASEKQLALTLEIEPHMPETMHTDRQRVERILTNLLGNAIKFTDHGTVSLTIGRPRPGTAFSNPRLGAGTVVAFSVSDTGIGIAPDARDRLFTPFEQLGAMGDRRRGGSGLGLAISRDSAALLGGELLFEPAPTGGSVFRCYLPERSVAQSAPHRSSAAAVPTKTPPARAITEAPLLLIEDDAVLAEQIAAIVHARNLEVLVAKTGAEGLRMARECRPRGVILDVKLPDIDGWAVMERLRDDPATSAIPVHFVSAVDAEQRGLALGAVGYVTKPASHADLSRVVRTLLAEPEAMARVLVVEDSEAEGEAIVAVLGAQGIRAEHVTTAAEALKLLQRDRFGCIILDLGLPDMDGRLLLESLPVASERATPRVVVHTGRKLDREEEALLETKAQAIVVKDGTSSARLVEEVRQVRKPSIAPEPRRDARAAAADERPLPLSGVHILLAEDDMRTAYAVSALLGERGAEVFVADNGLVALELLERHPEIRVVLMDVMMPELDGYQAMKRLRAEKRFRDLPVVALTARAMAGERERCIEAGASDYLTKPVDQERLLATITRWLKPADEHERPIEQVSGEGSPQ
jgi:CheY-like chemotaxis protein/signal transduction histidine kinase